MSSTVFTAAAAAAFSNLFEGLEGVCAASVGRERQGLSTEAGTRGREAMAAATGRRTSPRKRMVGEVSVSNGSEKVLEDSRQRSGAINVRDTPVFQEEGEDDLPELSTLLLGSTKDGNHNAALSKRTATDTKGRSKLVLSPDKSRDARTRNPRSPRRKVGESEASQIGQGIPQAATARQRITPPSVLLDAMPRLQPTKTTTRLPPLQPPPLCPQAPLENTTTTTRSSRQMQQRKSPGKRQVPPLSPVKKCVTSPAKTAREFSDSGFSGSESMAAAKAESTDNDKSLKLTHVDSLLLPLSGLALQSEDSKGDREAGFERKPSASKPRLLRQHGWESLNTRPTARKRGAMFVLEEAACRDDTEGGSDADDDFDDEFTDLSGFIVDDDADISFHGSESLSETDSESNRITRKSPVRRRLVRGGKKGTSDEPVRVLANELRSLSMENDGCIKNEKPKIGADGLAGAIAGMHLDDEDREPKRTRSEESMVEVVDLTSSPEKLQLASPFDHGGKIQKPRWPRKAANQQEPDHQEENQYPSSDSGNATTGRNAILRFSPPSRKPLYNAQRKESTFPLREANRNTLENAERNSHTFTTPPQTPPASPSKLRSPSKLNSPSKKLLLSPSKRANQIPQSPHRQSIDAFWSSEVINEWNDEYSPVKPPLTVSPKKKWKIWENESGSGSESPCESPARRIGSPAKAVGSPPKGPEADKKRAATAAAAAKRRFGDEKVDLARDLLRELDEKVSDGILARLSQSTGGVEVIWSKNLRSTAGRANWRRTVTKTSTGSYLKSDHARTVAEAGDVKVQHYASIELAEKIIDNEERLVNTLAHEYCHLANFMVSGVRDQPHGASFKRW